jgi:2-dehydropantoate 2-reductase
MSGIWDYTIVGAGAVGCVIGARLALLGKSVQLINRSPATSEAVLARGLLLRVDGMTHKAEVRACTPDQAQASRVAVVLTKTHQLEAAVSALLPALADAVWVTLQNGLGNGQRLAAWVGEDRVVHGVTMLPAVLHAPADVSTHGSSLTWLGPLSEPATPLADACCDALVADLAAAGIEAERVGAIQNKIWQKACFNSAMNGLCAISNGGPGLLKDVPDGLALAHELVDEISAVALADGATIDVAAVHALVELGAAEHRYHKPSMLQDLRAERLTEVEALNGTVDQRARVLGIDAPLNRMLLRLMRLRERAPAFWATQATNSQ